MIPPFWRGATVGRKPDATPFLPWGCPCCSAATSSAARNKAINNALLSDNEISAVDCNTNRALYDFTRRMIAFRQAHPALRRTSFFKGKNIAGDFPDIRWYGPDGAPQPDWEKGVALACRIDGRRQHTGADEEDDHLFLVFNAGPEPQEFECRPTITVPRGNWR